MSQMITAPADPSQTPKPEAFRTGRAAIAKESLTIQEDGGRFEAGMMAGVSLISRGEALGHGMWIDEVALDQVEYLAQSNPSIGIKSRFTHPSMSSDGTGKHLGRIHDALRVEDRVLGDLHFAKSAHQTPDGDLAEYVMTLAGEDPRAAGLSIVFYRDLEMERDFALAHGATEDRYGLNWENFESPDPNNSENYPHVRVQQLMAADVVDEPAANPDGLFDRQPEARKVDQLLSFALGLTKETPEGPAFGLDPVRAQEFLSRWMEQHGLQLSTQGDPTVTHQKDPAPAPAPVEDPAPVPTREELRAEFAADLRRYTEAFGADNGSAWFHEGVEFSDAQARHIEALTAERDQLAERVEELENSLASVNLGETEPLETVGAGEGKKSMEDFCKPPEPSAN